MPSTVLVVEDDASVLRFCRRSLEGAGFSVFTASGVEEAIRHLSDRGAPEFVLTDLNMEPLEGWTLLSWIRERGMTCPVGVMTGTPEDVEKRVRDAGGVGVLRKPFAEDALLRFVKEGR
jgi:DNA-binding response OmpR family regulator